MANEKDEKFDEKAMEKQDEKSADEKSWEEKWRRDPLSAIVWAAIFIWAGMVFLAANLGWLDFLTDPATSDWPSWLSRIEGAWSLVLVGAGLIVLIEVAVRLLVPEYRKPVAGSIIFAIILIGIGLGDLVNWGILWALLLIFLGVSIIWRGLRGGSKSSDQ